MPADRVEVTAIGQVCRSAQASRSWVPHTLLRRDATEHVASSGGTAGGHFGSLGARKILWDILGVVRT